MKIVIEIKTNVNLLGLDQDAVLSLIQQFMFPCKCGNKFQAGPKTALVSVTHKNINSAKQLIKFHFNQYMTFQI